MMQKRQIINNTAESVHMAIVQFSEFCHTAGLDATVCFRVQIIWSEILNNIIEHSLTALPAAQIEAICQIDEQYVTLITVDQGMPFTAPTSQDMPDSYAESGRGWPIIQQWANNIEHYRHQNANHLHVKLMHSNA